MTHRISVALVTVLAGTTLTLLGPSRPASAWQACGALGTLQVYPGLVYPALLGAPLPSPAIPPHKDHYIDVLIGQASWLSAFYFWSNIGGCVHPDFPPTLTATAPGVLKGYCGHLSGLGTLNGQRFAFIGIGTTLVLTGPFVGVALMTEAPATRSCLHLATNFATEVFTLENARANTFLLEAAGVGFGCWDPITPTVVLARLVDSDNLLPKGGPLLGVDVHLGLHYFALAPCVGPPTL